MVAHSILLKIYMYCIICQPSYTSTLKWAISRFTVDMIFSKLVNLLNQSTWQDYDEENSWPLRAGKCQMRENIIKSIILSLQLRLESCYHDPCFYLMPSKCQPATIHFSAVQNPSASNNNGLRVSSNYSNILAAITAKSKQNQHLC